MGIFSRISSLWGPGREDLISGGDPTMLAVTIAATNAEDSTSDVEGVDLGEFEFASSSRPTPRNGRNGSPRASAQVRAAREEIERLVGRVDSHLREQSRRAERAIGLLEGSSANSESIGVLRDQQERLVDSLEDIADSCRSSREQGLIAMSHLGAVADRLDRASETDERLIEAISLIESRLNDVTFATSNLHSDMIRTRRRQEARDLRISAALSRGNRMLLVGLILGTAAIVVSSGLAAAVVLLG